MTKAQVTNGAKSPVVWVAVGLSALSLFVSWSRSATEDIQAMRDRVTTIEVKADSHASAERVAIIEAQLAQIQRGQDLRARDVAGILHEPTDSRGADRLISLYQAGTATPEELARLSAIMRAVGDDKNQDEGLRSAALEMFRSIEAQTRPVEEKEETP